MAAAAINAAGGWESGPAKPEDFFGGLTREQTPEEMLAAIEAWTAELGGEDLTTGVENADHP